MSEANSKQPSDAYAQKTSDELVGILRAKDAQISKLLLELEVLRKMHFGPRSERSKRPLDPKTMLPFPGIAELLERVATVKKEREAAVAAVAAAAVATQSQASTAASASSPASNPPAPKRLCSLSSNCGVKICRRLARTQSFRPEQARRSFRTARDLRRRSDRRNQADPGRRLQHHAEPEESRSGRGRDGKHGMHCLASLIM